MGRRLLIRCLCSLALSTTMSGLLFFFTPIPLYVVAKRFASERFQVTGVRGTLYFGGTYDRVEIREPVNAIGVSAEGVHFRMRPADLLIGRRLAFSDSSIDRVTIRLPQMPPFAGLAAWMLSPPAPERKPPAVSVAETDPGTLALRAGLPTLDSVSVPLMRLGLATARFLVTGEDPWFKAVGIEDFRIARAEIAYERADGAPGGFAFENFRAKDALYRLRERRFALGELSIDDSRKKLAVKGLAIAKETAELSELSLKLRPALAPSVLARDLDFHAIVDGNLKDLRNVKASVEAFGGGLKGSIRPGGIVSLVFADFNPRDFFNGPVPIDHANCELSTHFIQATPPATVGDFKIEGTTFRFGDRPFEAEATRGEQTFLARIDIAGLFAGTHPTFALTSNASPSARDNLALLRHSATYAALDDAGRARIDADLEWFDRSTPALPGRAPAAVPAPASPK